MRVSLKNKKVLICGLNGTGKTYLSKYLARHHKAFVITMNPHEWETEDVIVGKCESVNDFEYWLKSWKVLKGTIDMIILDDFDMFFRTHLDTLKEFSDLVYRNRHYGVSVIAITRRPQNIPTKYYEIFEVLAIFTLESPTAIEKFNQIYNGLGELVKQLPYKSYKFVWKEIGQEPKIMKV